MLKKEITRIENLIKFLGDGLAKTTELKKEKSPSSIDEKDAKERAISEKVTKAKNLGFGQKYDEAIALYKEAVDYYEEINFPHQVKQLKWQILKLEGERDRNLDLEKENMILKEQQKDSIAKEREMRLMQEMEARKAVEERTIQERIKEREMLAQSQKAGSSRLQSIEDAKKSRLAVFEARKSGMDLNDYESERKKMEQKKRELLAKETREKEALDEIEVLLEKAKINVDNRKYDEAKIYYQDAAAIFIEIGWNHQAETLGEELRNVDKLKEEYELKLKKQKEQHQKEIEIFKKREEEYKRAEQARLEEIERKKRDLTPEQKQKVETANMLLVKAKSNEEKGKLEQALGRYEYILELVQGIPVEVINSDEITKKIAEIKDKI